MNPTIAPSENKNQPDYLLSPTTRSEPLAQANAIHIRYVPNKAACSKIRCSV